MPGEADDEAELPESVAVTVVKRQLGDVRRPGRLSDVPEKWMPTPSDRLKADWTDEDPVAKRFELALRALVKEIRRNQKAGTQITLANGHRKKFDTDEAIFQFSWDGDEALFEGASVSAQADGVQCRGRIVALGTAVIAVSLEGLENERVGVCVLFVDKTAMLEMLADRLKAIHTGEAKGFNTALANDVLENTGEEKPSTGE